MKKRGFTNYYRMFRDLENKCETDLRKLFEDAGVSEIELPDGSNFGDDVLRIDIIDDCVGGTFPADVTKVSLSEFKGGFVLETSEGDIYPCDCADGTIFMVYEHCYHNLPDGTEK